MSCAHTPPGFGLRISSTYINGVLRVKDLGVLCTHAPGLRVKDLGHVSAGLGLRGYGLVCTPAPGIAMQASGVLASLPTDSVDPCLEGHVPAITSGPGREREG